MKFSFSRLRILFLFGYKIFLASIIKTIYNDLRSLFIGKIYTPTDLAYYNRGQTFPQLIESNVVGTIDSVLFPAISKIQDSPDSMKVVLRRTIRVSSFILMPILAGIAAVSEPLVRILLTDKWIDCVPYLKILSFSFILSAVEVENLQAIKALGRSDIVLKQEIVKRSVGLIILLVSIPLGLKCIAYGMLLSQIVIAVINAYPTKKLLQYSFADQFKDVIPYLFTSLLMYGALNSFSIIDIGLWLDLLVKICLGVAIYLSVLVVIKDDSMKYVINAVSSLRS